jgi:hypothetical protein
VQASEKTYKVVEEVVKALSEEFNLQEYQQAVKEGRWYTLGSAVSSLSKNWIVNGWSSAYFLYVWGFHESELSTDDIIPYLDKVKRTLEEAEKVLNAYVSLQTTFI